MPVSRTVISAYTRVYSREQLEAALRIALDDRAAGVLVTQANFENGGGTGQMIQGDPNEVIEIIETCLQELDNPESAGLRPMAAGVSFRHRRSET